MGRVERFAEPTPYVFSQRPIYYEVDNNGCWNCKSHRLDRDGYARIDRNGREWLMHRYVYSITYQVFIEPGMVVRHKCDNPSCINPEHLELGTQADNMRDVILRNRQKKNVRRLTKEELNQITNSDLTIPKLALKYGVSHSTIVKAKAKGRIIADIKRASDKDSIKNVMEGRQTKNRHTNKSNI